MGRKRCLSGAAVAILLAIVLEGCNININPPETSVPEPPATSVPPTATNTSVPEPTATSEPTLAPEPTSTPTVTPLPAQAPQIISFTADREIVYGGEEVVVSWQIANAASASIAFYLYGYGGVSYSVDPSQGSRAVSPSWNGRIALRASNATGSVEAELFVQIECHHDWVSEVQANPPSMANECPSEAWYGRMAFQQFQGGFMVWSGPDGPIYAFYDGGFFKIFQDEFIEGDPESDPSIVPPAGLEQPIRGFGLVWRTNEHVRERLGWATEHERGYDGWSQSFSDGRYFSGYVMRGIDGTIYRLMWLYGTWFVYQP
jgi:hypothetical protein